MIRALSKFRWWLPNRIDGLRVRVRFALGLPLCKVTNPHLSSTWCDKRPGHRGDHRSRALAGRVAR